MRLLIVCFCFLLASNIFGQATTSKTNNYSYLLNQNDGEEKCKKLLDAAYSLSLKNDYSEQTLLLYTSALEQAKKIANEELIVKSLEGFARYYEFNGDIKNEKECYEKILAYTYTKSTTHLKAYILIRLGEVTNLLRYNKEAVLSLDEALGLYEQAGKKDTVALIYTALSNLYLSMHDSKKANEYCDKALKIAQESGFMESYAGVLFVKSLIFVESNDHTNAVRVLLRAANINKTFKTESGQTGMINCCFRISSSYLRLKKLDSAKYYLDVGKHMVDSMGMFNYFSSRYYNDLGAYYQFKGQVKEAVSNFKLSINTFSNKKNGQVQFIYDCIATTFRDAGRFDSAHYYRLLASIYQDSIYRQELEKSSALADELVNRYKTDLQNQKKVFDAEHQKEKLTRINFVLIAAIGLLILLIALFVLNNRNRQLKIKREGLISELDFLKAQLNPHFLFNSISNIHVLIDIDKQKASQVLVRFSELLRYQLYECNVDKIELSKELEFIENYVLFEKLRYDNKIKVSYSYTGDATQQLVIAPLLLQPFIENAFKHTPKNKHQENFVEVLIHLKNSQLNLTVNNNYDASTMGTLPGGIGLENVKKRLELIYKNKYSLLINENEGQQNTYLVNLTLTLHA